MHRMPARLMRTCDARARLLRRETRRGASMARALFGGENIGLARAYEANGDRHDGHHRGQHEQAEQGGALDQQRPQFYSARARDHLIADEGWIVEKNASSDFRFTGR